MGGVFSPQAKTIRPPSRRTHSSSSNLNPHAHLRASSERLGLQRRGLRHFSSQAVAESHWVRLGLCNSYLQPVYIGCHSMSGHLSAKGLCPHRKDGNASCDFYVLARTQPIVKTIRPPVCLSVFTPIVVRSIKRVRARSRFDPQHSRLASKAASFARVACSGSSELLGQQLRGLCHCRDRSPGRVGGG